MRNTVEDVSWAATPMPTAQMMSLATKPGPLVQGQVV